VKRLSVFVLISFILMMWGCEVQNAQDNAQVSKGEAASSASGGILKKPGKIGYAVGDIAPEINAQEWINSDKPVKLKDLRGKIVVVEFWATWCPPCRISIPHLVEMYEKYKDKGVVFVSLTRENRQSANIDSFVKKMNMTYIVGTGSISGRDYGVRGIPHAFVIDRKGRILWKGHPMAGLEKEIERALKL